MRYEVTPAQEEAVRWYRHNHGRSWLRCLKIKREDLPNGYQYFHDHPFGIPEWNEYTRLAREVLAKYGEAGVKAVAARR